MCKAASWRPDLRVPLWALRPLPLAFRSATQNLLKRKQSLLFAAPLDTMANLPAIPLAFKGRTRLHPAAQAIGPGVQLTPVQQRDHLVGHLAHLKHLLANYEGYLTQLEQSKTDAERWHEGMRRKLRDNYCAHPEKQGAEFARRYSEARVKDRSDIAYNQDTIRQIKERMNEPRNAIINIKLQIECSESDLEEAKHKVGEFVARQQQQRAVQPHVSPPRAPSPPAPHPAVLARLNTCLDGHPVRLINKLYTWYAVALQIDSLVTGTIGGPTPTMARGTDWRRTGRYRDLLKLTATFYDVRTDAYARGASACGAWLRLLNNLRTVGAIIGRMRREWRVG